MWRVNLVVAGTAQHIRGMIIDEYQDDVWFLRRHDFAPSRFSRARPLVAGGAREKASTGLLFAVAPEREIAVRLLAVPNVGLVWVRHRVW